MKINFDKMEGAGNDFIFIDNRAKTVPASLKSELAQKCCRRRFGVGADGMMFIETDPEFDFAWDFYNADGSVGEMCGNGARCAARFANSIGAAGAEMTFRTLAGPIRARLTDRGAKVRLTDAVLPREPATITLPGETFTVWNINTGVPHAVIKVENAERVDVVNTGRAIRHHGFFAPAGTNVDFFAPGTGNALSVRTYERGVEDETLACGTGAAAAAIVAALHSGGSSPATVRTRGGAELVVHFDLTPEKAENIFLEGPANRVFSGTLET